VAAEKKIETYLRKRVLETGGRIRKLKWIGQRGAPDRWIWWPEEKKGLGPVAAFVEVKAPGKKPTVQQHREHKRLREDGFGVEVVDSKESVDTMLGFLTTELGPVIAR
jgi:hypothetical protein